MAEENLIKILESIRADISELIQNCEGFEDLPLYSNSETAYNNVLVIIDQYLNRARSGKRNKEK